MLRGVGSHNAELFQELDCALGCVPCGSRPPFGLFACQGRQDFDGLGQNVSFLLFAEGRDVFVGVSVEATGMYKSSAFAGGLRLLCLHFMPGVPDLGHLGWEGFDRVSRNKPCRLDAVLVPQLEESVYPDCCAEDTPRDIRCASSWC